MHTARLGSGTGTLHPGHRHVAFSLVELVIVIAIIGIIAAIAVPRISSSATGSNETALAADLNVLRQAIDAYAAEHNSVFPGANADGGSGTANSAEAFVSQLTQYSDADGTVAAAPSGEYIYGPYIANIPKLPVGKNKGLADVVIDASNSPPLVKATAAGWVYNPNTGEINANSDDPNLGGTRTFDQY